MTVAPNLAYAIAFLGFLGLFGLRMLWPTVLDTNPQVPVALILLVTVGPLLLPLRGFLQGNRRSSAWLAYLSLFFFMHGLIEAYSNVATRLFACLEVIFSLMVFSGITLFLRALKTKG